VLGVVPSGSGNGLAAALGVPRDARTAIATAFDGRTRAIDVGLIAGRPFFNIAGVGFDARVAKLFNQQAIGRRGGWPYVVIGVREGCRYCGREYDVQLDGDRRRVRALLIAFANGREYGIGACIAPGAQIDDGLLDATIVEERSVLARFWHARHLARGTVHLAPKVTARAVARAVVEAEGPLEFHVDGEPGTAEDRLEVSILPGALKVRVR
jgi:YegS/Rv2252/BmrU family lipid kinase